MVIVLIAFLIMFIVAPIAIGWSAMYDAYKCIPEFSSYSTIELLWASFIDTLKNLIKLN